MTTNTPYDALSSTAILVVGLCASLMAVLGGSPAGAAAAQIAGVPELRYLPADAAVVAYANVKDVMSSELRRRLRELRSDDQTGRQGLEEKTGINLETDVDSVVAGMLPRGEETETVVIMKGRFDNARVESFAREHGGIQETYRDARLITGKEGDRTRAVAFLAPDLMAIGDSGAVRRAIDSRHGEGNVTANAGMMKRIAGVADGASAWAVGSFDVLASRANLFDTVSTQIPEIQFFSASGRVNGSVAGSFRVETRDDQAAATLRVELGDLLATARLQVASQPEVQAILESLELGGTGREVALSFDIPIQFFESTALRNGPPAGQ